MATSSRNDRLTRNVWLNLAKNTVQIRILTPAGHNSGRREIKQEELADDDYKRVCSQTFVDNAHIIKDTSLCAEDNCQTPRMSDDDQSFSAMENMADIPLDISVSHVEASSLTAATVSTSFPTNERSNSAPLSTLRENYSNKILPEHLRACGSVKKFLPKFQSSDDRIDASTEPESYVLRTLTPNSESSYPGLSSCDRLDALEILCRPSSAKTPRQSIYGDYSCSNLYRQKRERNNQAVRRCREKSRMQRQLMVSENSRLKEENERIRKSLAAALRSVEAYRQRCNYLQELLNANRVVSRLNTDNEIPNRK